jgi:hypothetical protein
MKYDFFIKFFISILFFNSCNTEESLKKNTAFTYAYITDFSYKRYGNPSETKISMIINDKKSFLTLKNHNYCFPQTEKERDIMRKIPIIIAYDSTRTGIRRILINKVRMKEYNYELPDSLVSIYEEYIFYCQ